MSAVHALEPSATSRLRDAEAQIASLDLAHPSVLASLPEILRLALQTPNTLAYTFALSGQSVAVDEAHWV